MILDACCGAMKMYDGWHKKLGDELITIDIRKGDFSYYSPYGWNPQKQGFTEVIVRPTVKADMKYLPFRENIFDAVIFDPPHLDVGKGSNLDKLYGSWTRTECIKTLVAVNEEFKRVLKPRGFIIMKVRRKYFFSIFEPLLTNFCFFLPIERRSGAYHKKDGKHRRILWAIGQLKGE